jgi:hypothetical protein
MKVSKLGIIISMQQILVRLRAQGVCTISSDDVMCENGAFTT